MTQRSNAAASTSPPRALKPLRRPRLWLGLWWFAVALVVVASLLPAFLLPEVPAGGDKLEHFGGYFLLAAAAVQLFATWRHLLRASLGLVLLGVGLEIAQGLLTTTRQMDVYDALANSAGVLAGTAIVLTPLRDALLRLERR
ncbi:MAG: VanZ family protein [Luteimonas sp.]